MLTGTKLIELILSLKNGHVVCWYVHKATGNTQVRSESIFRRIFEVRDLRSGNIASRQFDLLCVAEDLLGVLVNHWVGQVSHVHQSQSCAKMVV